MLKFECLKVSLSVKIFNCILLIFLLHTVLYICYHIKVFPQLGRKQKIIFLYSFLLVIFFVGEAIDPGIFCL